MTNASKFTTKQFDSLPKWAQEHIRTLIREAGQAQDELKRVAGGGNRDLPHILRDPYSKLDGRYGYYIGDEKEKIQFQVSDNNWFGVRFKRDELTGKIGIMIDAADSLQIVPCSSNRIYVFEAPRI